MQQRNHKGSATLKQSNRRLKRPENSLNIALLFLRVKTNIYCWHRDSITQHNLQRASSECLTRPVWARSLGWDRSFDLLHPSLSLIVLSYQATVLAMEKGYTVMQLYNKSKLFLIPCFTFQGCRDGIPDERGGTTFPSPRQEAVRGGLPVGGHPGAAVSTGV